MPVQIDLNFPVGSTGAVGTVKGSYVSSVTRMGVGAYKIILNDNYSAFYTFSSWQTTAVTGAEIALTTGLTLGQSYVITTLGTSTTANWQTAGLPVGLTPTLGMSFVAITASAGTGTGKVKAVAPSAVTQIELVGDPNLELAPNPTTNQGAILFIQCYGATDSSTTTLTPTDPTSGVTLGLKFLLSNSSITIGGE